MSTNSFTAGPTAPSPWNCAAPERRALSQCLLLLLLLCFCLPLLSPFASVGNAATVTGDAPFVLQYGESGNAPTEDPPEAAPESVKGPKPPGAASPNGPELKDHDRKLTRMIIRLNEFLDYAHGLLYAGLLEPMGQIFSALLTLYIVLMGMGFVTGTLSIKLSQLSSSILRVAVIAVLLSPMSFELFNYFVVDVFRTVTNSLITFMTDTALTTLDPAGPLATSNPTTPDKPVGPLTPVDLLLEKVLTPSSLKIWELLMEHGRHPQALVSLVVLSLVLFFGAIGVAVSIYLLILVATTLLFGLAPIFITMLLFQQTRTIFYGWINLLIQFAIQPVFLFGFMALGLLGMEMALFRGPESLNALFFAQQSQTTNSWDAISEAIARTAELHEQELMIHLAVIALLNFVFLVLMLSVPKLSRALIGPGIGAMQSRF